MRVNEVVVKGELVELLKETLWGSVVLRHEDVFRTGVPDISITWAGRTVWLEIKYANPRVRAKALQNLTCRALARVGLCFYVIYAEPKRGRANRRTYFVRPSDDWEVSSDFVSDPRNFDHRWVVERVQEAIRERMEKEVTVAEETGHDNDQTKCLHWRPRDA